MLFQSFIVLFLLMLLWTGLFSLELHLNGDDHE